MYLFSAVIVFLASFLPHILLQKYAIDRVGWSTRQGELQGAVGGDRYSYGYRDISGSKIHESIRDDAYGEPYGPGDIVG